MAVPHMRREIRYIKQRSVKNFMETKNNHLSLTITFFVLGILAATYAYVETTEVEKLQTQIHNLYQESAKTNDQLQQNNKKIESSTQNNKELEEQNKDLQAELKTKSAELLRATTTQRTQYEEQRNKWRTYAAGITSNLVKDLERTARNCWDSDRDDFEDCIDDEFEDDSDQEINQILNLA